ncbi:hypothetical protein CRUP_028684 [Coryphaenoides rupestris]|nr:hypothetical protein CRUP_028684 [Coryphaenoides rupestris]
MVPLHHRHHDERITSESWESRFSSRQTAYFPEEEEEATMGFCPSMLTVSRRGRYVLALLLCLSALVWIAIYMGDTVKAVHVTVATAAVQIPVKWEGWRFSLSRGDAGAPPLPARGWRPGAVLQAYTDAERGGERDEAVAEGRYQPPECTARQSVAILVPHRGREKHLLYLLHHLHPFLQRQQLHYAIYVIQQAGEATFNRAKLLNVGYIEALKDRDWDCFVFHDVDLVPEDDRNLYMCDSQPKHMVVGRNATGYKMRLLGRTAQVWRKEGLNSCSYKTLSTERWPLYVNITVDIGTPPRH